MSYRSWYRCAVPLALAACVLVPSITAAQGVDTPHIPLRTALADINTLRVAYVDAFNAHDAAAVSAMYTDDAIAVGPDGTALWGKDQVAKANAAGAETWPHAVIKSDTTKVYGATAVDEGTWTTHPKEGGEVVFRYLAVLRHDISGWKLQYVSDTPVTAKMKM